jgi:hypothetical protein
MRTVCAVDVRVARLYQSETFLHDCDFGLKVFDVHSRIACVFRSIAKAVELTQHLSLLSLSGLDVVDS